MKAIWKFPIKPDSHRVPAVVVTALPAGTRILSANLQNDNFFVWAEVDTKETRTEKRTFEIYGTGHAFNHLEYKNTRTFIGTVFASYGDVYHVYEIVERNSSTCL